MRSPMKSLLLAAPILLLAGCSAGDLPEFATEQTDRDVVADARAADGIASDTTRFVGEVDGVELFLAKSQDDEICLIQLRDGNFESTACSSGGGLGTIITGGPAVEVGDFRYLPDAENRPGREQISDSVVVIRGGL